MGYQSLRESRESLDGRYRPGYVATAYGAKGDGATDDTAAIQAAFTAAAATGGVAVIPGGKTFLVSSQLNLPRGASLIMEGATLKASADISGAMLTVGDLTNWWRNKFIKGGYLDCDGKADHAIEIYSGRNAEIDGVTWMNPKMHGLILGNASATYGSHEFHVTKCMGDKTLNAAVASGSVGIWATSKCYDSVLSDNVIVGAETSFLTEGSANTHIGGHGYGISDSAQFPHTVFKDSGSDNIYQDCYPDTPSAYGFWFTSASYRWTILGGRVINNPSIGTDNTVVGVHTELSDPNTAAIIGLSTSGGPSARIASDYDGYIGSQNLKTYGCQSSNVVSPNLRIDNAGSVNIRRYRMTGTSPAVTAGAGAGTTPPTPTMKSNSRDQGGAVNFGTGAAPAATSPLAYVTFSTAFSITPTVTITPQNAATAALGLYVSSTSTTAFAVEALNAPSADQGATAYVFTYHIDTPA